MITLEQGVELIWEAFGKLEGGEIYVKKIPSMRVTDMAKAVDPNAKQVVVGIRPGEKLHEQMIGQEDAPYTYEYEDYYKILPSINGWGNDPERIKNGVKVPYGFSYTSDNNDCWMSIDELAKWLKLN